MKLSIIFTDHMVLQAGLPIRIFGEGAGRAEVAFCGSCGAVESNGENWIITLPAMPYGGPYEMTVTLNGEETVLRDIYIGEVWFAGGQSNMEMPLFCIENGFEFAKHAESDMLRLFTVPRRPVKDIRFSSWHFNNNPEIETPWQLCEEKTVLNFSAIGYLAAKQLQEKLGVAVGVISCNYGGTWIEHWTKRSYLQHLPQMQAAMDTYDKRAAQTDMEEYRTRYLQAAAHRNRVCDEDKVDYIGKTRTMGIRATVLFPGRGDYGPVPTGPYDLHPLNIGCLHEAMTARIVPYGMRGVMWYQGESNEDEDYCQRYLAYMQCMKDQFQNQDLKFYAMELASFGYSWKDDTTIVTDGSCGELSFAHTREQQYLATRLAPNNYVVTTMELGDPNNIHSIHKAPMAHRLALKILKYSYGFSIEADQPVAESWEFKDGKAYVTVKHGEGLFSSCPAAVDIFVADESLVLKKANLEIRDNVLILSHQEIAQPILVRYGFDRSYMGQHIHNRAGLPLAPFRTDK